MTELVFDPESSLRILPTNEIDIYTGLPPPYIPISEGIPKEIFLGLNVNQFDIREHTILLA